MSHSIRKNFVVDAAVKRRTNHPGKYVLRALIGEYTGLVMSFKRIIVIVFLSGAALLGNVYAQPASKLLLSDTNLTFVADIDSPPEVHQLKVSVADIGHRWSSRSSASWLEHFPIRGSGSQDITLRLSPQNLAPGQYTTQVAFTGQNFRSGKQVLEISFTVNAERGVTIHDGNGQIAAINAAFPEPMQVQVLDEDGRPLADETVSFETIVGSTRPSKARVKTDAAGIASFQPQLLEYGAVGVTARSTLKADSSAYFQGVVTGWISTLAGDGIQAHGGDYGPAAWAHFNAPFGMALQDGGLIVVDYFNHTLRRIDLSSGQIYPLAGTAKQGFNGDGLAAKDSVLNGPFGIALSPTGEVIFSDYYNNRIRVIDGDSKKIETIAGTGRSGNSGDEGPGVEAQIDVPLDIAADSAGNIYLSDWHHHVVRKIDARSGRMEAVAGIGWARYTGEGIATKAGLATPLGLSFDKDDNLYIADYGNNRVRKIDAQSGLISTVAGSGSRGFSGDGGLAVSAQLNRPYNVYADAHGDLFISDSGNHRIRHVDSETGVISTIAGQGEFGYSGDQGLALSEKLKGPFSVITDDNNNLYVAEYFGHKIRKIGGQKEADTAVPDRIDLLRRQSRQIFGTFPLAEKNDNAAATVRIELGRSLFHDTRLSADGTVSCSTCHVLEEFGVDGLKVATGIHDQMGNRNSPSVFNAALQDSQFWDGRVKTIEQQAKVPLLDQKEMAMPSEEAVVAAVAAVPEYSAMFTQAFTNDHPPLTFKNISAALGAFQRGLLTPHSEFDQFMAGDNKALTPQQLLGLETFLREGCASCHSGPLLGGQDLHLIRDYPNTREGTELELRKRLGNTHKFKIAPLRNVAMTAPYLHDGRDAALKDTLGKRLDAYLMSEASIKDAVDMTDTELAALLAFFESLTGVIDQDYIKVPSLPALSGTH
ncbi:MAG: cytochrome c peroxidase [Halioglobus sp.]